MWLIRQLRIFAPDLVSEIDRRYDVLKGIYYLQPVGRRALAAALNLTEREVRGQIDTLRSDGLIETEAAGMHTTEQGRAAVEELNEFFMQLRNILPLEQAVATQLNIKKTLAVPGNSQNCSVVIDELAGRAAYQLWQELDSGDYVAVHDGPLTLAMSVSAVALGKKQGITFMPALAWQTVRGFMPYDAVYALARAAGGKRLRPKLPEKLTATDFETHLATKQVKPYINALHKAKAAVFDINTAEKSIIENNYPYRLSDTIRERGAVAECMGIFYNADGKLVYAGGRIGLTPEMLAAVPVVIGLAAGIENAAAVKAVAAALPRLQLVTDQALADALIGV